MQITGKTKYKTSVSFLEEQGAFNKMDIVDLELNYCDFSLDELWNISESRSSGRFWKGWYALGLMSIIQLVLRLWTRVLFHGMI